MKYSLDIREENVPAHLDIEKDIHKKANGVFTFTIKLNNGKIVDYNVVEYVDPRDYLQLASVVIQELSFSYNHGGGVQKTEIRHNNI
ncbi:MAG: hypothetical protein A2163_07955 [Actinobacteria bacterium RBG_13_35_12]|nr:MAG: hypothetical protein A2163_07955 [Actinobacteria bacterium RBG_13_35_12]